MMLWQLHLPVLPALLPLLLAPLGALIRSGRIVWGLAMLAVTAGFIASLQLASLILGDQQVRYFFGNWQAPTGIEHMVDPLSVLLLLVVNGMALVIMPFALKSVERELGAAKSPLFYTLYLLCLAGLNGMILTHDAFNLYVFLEISSLATYAMIALGRDRRALTAAFHYLILGTIGATFILIAVGLLYIQTGTLNMGDLAARLPAVYGQRPVLAAFAFLTVGLTLKFALFPLHVWLPNAYAYAPSFVSAFLAATATKVAIYALLRFTLTVFGIDFSFGQMPMATVLGGLSVLAVLVGSYVAVHQYHLKKMLAFSSVAQIGYITLGISLGSVAGLTAGMIHIANHALAKGALFLALGCMAYRLSEAGIHHLRLDTVSGLARRMPITCMAFVLAGLALVGMPLSSGFISKWYLILAALDDHRWWVIVVTILGSLLAMVYIWRVVEALYFRATPEVCRELKEAPLTLLAPTVLMVLGAYYFGLDTRYTIGIAHKAASSLFERHLELQLSAPAEDASENAQETGQEDRPDADMTTDTDTDVGTDAGEENTLPDPLPEGEE